LYKFVDSYGRTGAVIIAIVVASLERQTQKGALMSYQIGDPVVHCTYGMGEVVGVEEKTMGGETRRYYVVKVGTLTLWTPVDDPEGSNLRPPASRTEFQASLKIIHTAGEPLADNKYQRQSQVVQRLKKKSLEEICSIIRDLVAWSRVHRLTKDDSDLLRRAEDILLDEWELSLGTSRDIARQELNRLLALDTVDATVDAV